MKMLRLIVPLMMKLALMMCCRKLKFVTRMQLLIIFCLCSQIFISWRLPTWFHMETYMVLMCWLTFINPYSNSFLRQRLFQIVAQVKSKCLLTHLMLPLYLQSCVSLLYQQQFYSTIILLDVHQVIKWCWRSLSFMICSSIDQDYCYVKLLPLL